MPAGRWFLRGIWPDNSKNDEIGYFFEQREENTYFFINSVL
jgi:hypothetical protein